MADKIRILLLEDQSSDAELAEYEIKKSIASYQLKWVENRKDYIQALGDFEPEVIISDYNLPTITGLEALKIKMTLKPEVPLIIFTGSLNEDIAVECIKAGAIDYVIKEHLKRLGPAVLNALEQKEIIAAKKRAELELIKSEERFHRLADNMPDMIYRIITEPSISFEYVNPAAVEITGYSIDDFHSNPELGNSIIYPDDLPILIEKINSGEYFFKPIVTRLTRKDGAIIWFEQRNIPIYNDNGKIIAIEGIAQDITEKRNSEILKQAIYSIAQAANSTKSLDELYAKVHNTIATIMPANNFYIALYHKDTNEISFPYFIDEKDIQPQKRKFQKGLTEYVLTTGKSLLCNSDCSKKLKQEGKIQIIGAPNTIWLGIPLNFENTTIGIMALQHYQDETVFGEKERSMLEYVSTQVAKAIVYKQTEKQISKLSIALSQSPVSIVITNILGEIEYVNPNFTEVTGYSIEEVSGKNPRLFQSGITPIEVYSDLWKTVLSGKVWQGEFVNKKKNGDFYTESAKISPVLDDVGNIAFLLAIKEDITEKKRIENELITAKVKAEESDKLKTAFLQNMSHEIRTPMNAIVGFSELIELELENPSKLKYYTNVIRQRADDLLGIINELLDIARIESGQLQLKVEQTDLNKLLEELHSLYSEHKLQVEKPSINLIVKEIPNEFCSTISTDSGKLKQIFVNLIHNAFKFTNQGNIEFGFHSTSNDTITFFVSDTGVGISENMKDLIFERFRKSFDESVYVQDGLGLGLAIVKGLLNLFNGNIWVETEPNKGSTFYFTIPYITASIKKDIETQSLKSNYDWSNFTLLIVEDDTFNVAFFIELLQHTNIKYLIGTTGQLAISLFNSNQNIDLVLMDIKLPDISGIEVTKEFKRLRPELPIIAQTAYASESDKKTVINAGCDDFLAKPIKRDIFLSVLSKYLNSK